MLRFLNFRAMLAALLILGLLFAALALYKVAGGSSFGPSEGSRGDQAKTVDVHASYVFEAQEDPRLVGFSENVFVGTVIRNTGSTANAYIPQGQFEVQVKESIKGNLSGNVIVNQWGGYDAADQTTYLVEGDPLLKPGETAVFVTGARPGSAVQDIVAQPYGHVIVGNPGESDEAIRTEEEQAVSRFEVAESQQIPFTTVEEQGPPNSDPLD